MIVFIFFLMIRRPPRSTRTDTLFPYTTLFQKRRLTSDLKGTGAMDGNMKMQRSSYGRFGAMIVTSTIVMFVLMYLNSYDLDHVFYRSEEHTSELQSLMRISYDVLCLKKKKTMKTTDK